MSRRKWVLHQEAVRVWETCETARSAWPAGYTTEAEQSQRRSMPHAPTGAQEGEVLMCVHAQAQTNTHTPCVHAMSLLCNPLDVARQAPLSKGVSRQEYWSELSQPRDQILTSYVSCIGRWVFSPLVPHGKPTHPSPPHSNCQLFTDWPLVPTSSIIAEGASGGSACCPPPSSLGCSSSLSHHGPITNLRNM